jgi:hypothetical protein
MMHAANKYDVCGMSLVHHARPTMCAACLLCITCAACLLCITMCAACLLCITLVKYDVCGMSLVHHARQVRCVRHVSCASRSSSTMCAACLLCITLVLFCVHLRSCMLHAMYGCMCMHALHDCSHLRVHERTRPWSQIHRVIHILPRGRYPWLQPIVFTNAHDHGHRYTMSSTSSRVSDTPGCNQSAYRVQVWGSAGSVVSIDTGVVTSSALSHALAAGALPAATLFGWRVAVTCGTSGM